MGGQIGTSAIEFWYGPYGPPYSCPCCCRSNRTRTALCPPRSQLMNGPPDIEHRPLPARYMQHTCLKPVSEPPRHSLNPTDFYRPALQYKHSTQQVQDGKLPHPHICRLPRRLVLGELGSYRQPGWLLARASATSPSAPDHMTTFHHSTCVDNRLGVVGNQDTSRLHLWGSRISDQSALVRAPRSACNPRMLSFAYQRDRMLP